MASTLDAVEENSSIIDGSNLGPETLNAYLHDFVRTVLPIRPIDNDVPTALSKKLLRTASADEKGYQKLVAVLEYLRDKLYVATFDRALARGEGRDSRTSFALNWFDSLGTPPKDAITAASVDQHLRHIQGSSLEAGCTNPKQAAQLYQKWARDWEKAEQYTNHTFAGTASGSSVLPSTTDLQGSDIKFSHGGDVSELVNTGLADIRTESSGTKGGDSQMESNDSDTADSKAVDDQRSTRIYIPLSNMESTEIQEHLQACRSYYAKLWGDDSGGLSDDELDCEPMGPFGSDFVDVVSTSLRLLEEVDYLKEQASHPVFSHVFATTDQS